MSTTQCLASNGRAKHPRRHRGWVAAAAMIASSVLIAGSPAYADPTKVFAKHTAGSPLTVDHSTWDALLKSYVVPGADGINRIAYAGFKSEGHARLKSYISALERTDPSQLDRPEQFAFWANLYNAKTIDVVLEAYPVASIKNINLGGSLFTLVTGGPWKAKILQVNGEALSLDNVEHDILRPIFKDPRVHYAVNCASIGCPNLMVDAFTGANLEALLDKGAKAYVNHPRGLKVEAGKITASSIYSWFVADFGGNAAGVLQHARKYAEPQLKTALDGVGSIADYDYDWSLNEAKR